MATQDMVDFHCELFDRCINHSDEQEDTTNANDANLKMSKDAKDVMEAVKKVHKVCPIENNTNLNSIFCLIKSSKIDFIFLPAFYLIM